MDNWKNFTSSVAKEVSKLRKAYEVDVDRDELFKVYIDSFPEGTNPLHKKRTEHDCNCCKNFIRNMGHVVTISETGQIKTIWDVDAQGPYKQVAKAIRDYVKSRPIRSVWMTKFPKFGAESNVSKDMVKYNHFWGQLEATLVSPRYTEIVGEQNTQVKVLERGLKELSKTAINFVLTLINTNGIYRGAEFKNSVELFLNIKSKYHTLPDKGRAIIPWMYAGHPVCGFKNTVIGTLVSDISSGVDEDSAVRSFESKVAPTNYKRPTAIITQKMVENSLEEMRKLGIEQSIYRRYAEFKDVSVNSVLFVDNKVRGKMKDSISELLKLDTVNKTSVPSNPVKISGEQFFTNILPKAKSLKIFVENSHCGNFVSLTAPQYPESPPLFKWDNGFGWSYDGNVTDSVKERVKKAGGNIHADLRVSLSWYNTDDLDLHCLTPSKEHIYYGNKKNILDVDMNVHNPVKNAVENLAFIKPANGKYVIRVVNYRKRESIDIGFDLEIECGGHIYTFSHTSVAPSSIECLEINMNSGKITEILIMNDGIKEGMKNSEKWGVKTNSFVDVSTVVLSPNHWDKPIGNKHWFFILDGCINPSETRGMYNEFLRPELDKHRKVFEVLGERTKCKVSNEQLSGIGFSSTRNDRAIMVVDNRSFEVSF